MRYWLIKSEPDAYSIDDLARDKVSPWTGIRNYQARNFMRDQMKVGDQAFFYHSSCEVPAIVGIAEVSKTAYPDATQFDCKSKYFDEKATPDKPRWLHVDFRFIKKTRPLPLTELREHKALARMQLLARGNRLSITPVDPDAWKYILGLMKK